MLKLKYKNAIAPEMSEVTAYRGVISKIAGACMVLGFAGQAAALGLGNLDVQSNLEEPFNGVIELNVAASDDASSIEAEIASRDEFVSLGLDYPAYLEDISVEVEGEGDDVVLRLNSNDVIIKEPYLQILVKVDWSGGSFLREYTALINPPVYAAETPNPISEPKSVGSDQSYQIDEDVVRAEPLGDAQVIDESFTEPEVVQDSTIDDDFYDSQAIEDLEPVEFLEESASTPGTASTCLLYTSPSPRDS